MVIFFIIFFFINSVGKPKYKPVLPSSNELQVVGNFKEENRGLLKLKYAIDKGLITNWDDMKIIWDYGFSQLNVSTRELKEVKNY